MEWYKGRLCVTVDDLTSNDGGEAIMSVPSYRYYSNKNYFRYVRRGKGLGCYALIEFEPLPPRIKARFIDKYGDPVDKLRREPITEEFETDRDARDFYFDWLRPDGEHLTKEQQEEYTRNAAVLNVLVRQVNNWRSKRKAHARRAEEFWESLLVTSENYREIYGHSLPEGKSRLQTIINSYKKNGYQALISGKIGNNNSIKITDEVGDFAVAMKRCHHPIYSDLEIFEMINGQAAERGWKPLRSPKALTQFLHREDVEPRWLDAVIGEKEAQNRYARKNRLTPVKRRDALWYGDGTKLNLYYKAYDERGNMVVRTTQVYEVMDAYSEVFLGYHISDTEDFNAQYHAFRMAIETYRYRPYEIVVDNQGGHRKAMNIGFLQRIATSTARHSSPYNPSGKSIEQAFGRFQQKYIRRLWNNTGQNITATGKYSRENLEYIDANEDMLLTLDQLKEVYAKLRQEWNMGIHPATGKPRLDMYLDSRNEGAKAVNKLDMMEMFWIPTDKQVQFTQSGITIQVNKQKYSFEVFDPETGLPDFAWRRDNTYKKFFVYYDPNDMTHVKLYKKEQNGERRYVTDAFPYASFARAMQDQTPEEKALIRTLVAMSDEERIKRAVEAAALEVAHGVSSEQLGFNSQKIKGFSSRKAERVMDTVTKPHPRDEITDPGASQKHISNLTAHEMRASRIDKI